MSLDEIRSKIKNNMKHITQDVHVQCLAIFGSVVRDTLEAIHRSLGYKPISKHAFRKTYSK